MPFANARSTGSVTLPPFVTSTMTTAPERPSRSAHPPMFGCLANSTAICRCISLSDWKVAPGLGRAKPKVLCRIESRPISSPWRSASEIERDATNPGERSAKPATFRKNTTATVQNTSRAPAPGARALPNSLATSSTTPANRSGASAAPTIRPA